MATAASILAPQQSQPTTPATIVFSEYQAQVFNSTEAAYKSNGYLNTPLFEDSYLLSKATAQYIIEYIPLSGNNSSVQSRALEVYRGVLGIPAPITPPPPPPPLPTSPILPVSVPPVRGGGVSPVSPVGPVSPVSPVAPVGPAIQPLGNPITTPTTFTPPTSNPPSSPPTTPGFLGFNNLFGGGQANSSGFYGSSNPLFGGLGLGSSLFGGGGLFGN